MLLAAAVIGVAGCSEKAPVTNRLVHEHPIDLRYLHEVFIPAYRPVSRAKLTRSVQHLEACLAEFEAVMHNVAQGKIDVRQVKGHWLSTVDSPDAWIVADYADRLGPVIDFQKHQNKNPAPMIYSFRLNDTGYITRADMPPERFDFDEAGRLQRWHGENEPYEIGSNQSLQPTPSRRDSFLFDDYNTSTDGKARSR